MALRTLHSAYMCVGSVNSGSGRMTLRQMGLADVLKPAVEAAGIDLA